MNPQEARLKRDALHRRQNRTQMAVGIVSVLAYLILMAGFTYGHWLK